MTKTVGLFVAFVATVFGANWAIGRWGIVPIGFRLTAPAGLYFVGLAFALRDGLREAAGDAWRWWVMGAIVLGAGLSALLADAVVLPGGIVLASAGRVALGSGLAFLFSETADALVYEPLRNKSWPLAAGLSNLVGTIVDSVLFLALVFGSLDHLAGQIVGKMYMGIVGIGIVWVVRRHRHRVGGAPTCCT